MASSNQRQPPPFAAKSSDKYANPTSTQPLPPPLTTTYPTHPPPGLVYTQGYPLYTNGYPYPPTAPTNYGTQIRRIRPFSLYCGILAAVCFFLAIFIMAVALRPKLPVYKVVSMSVANFTVTPALSGEWDTNISIENRNHMVRVFISDLRVDVVYKEGVVAVNYSPDFALNKKDIREMDVKASSSDANEALLEKTTMDDMVKELATGSVTFALRVSSLNAFKFGLFSMKSSEVVAICYGLKLVFQNNNSTGTLNNGGSPIECQQPAL